MKIEVDTVDSYQGREKDILILSCVRSQGIGFLKSQNRLCVALTRARYSLIVIGKAQCLSGDPMWNKLIEDAKDRRLYREIPEDYCSSPLEGTKRGIIERAILATEAKSMIAEESRLGERHTFHRRE
jgi:superfamily I DNA and/or RNA helicase